MIDDIIDLFANNSYYILMWSFFVLIYIPATCFFKRTIWFEGNKIVICNGFRDRIFVNNKKIISRFKLIPHRYEFKVDDMTIEVDYYIKASLIQCGVDVRINGQLILSDK
ncbi:hypothetical protein A9D46_14790 [Photobacterium damselae subsp. damselae]|nr:hypothetical protein A9D46_14790 [Photobacterium damselae subsp. damselae]